MSAQQGSGPPARVLLGPLDALTAARALVPRFAARVGVSDWTRCFPVEDFADLRAGGLLGLMVMAPSRLGGPGGAFADDVEIAIVLAAGNASIALAYNMHASVTGAIAAAPEASARTSGCRGSGSPSVTRFFSRRSRARTMRSR